MQAQTQLTTRHKKLISCINFFHRKAEREGIEQYDSIGNQKIVHAFGGRVYFGNVRSTTMREYDVESLYKLGVLVPVNSDLKKFTLAKEYLEK